MLLCGIEPQPWYAHMNSAMHRQGIETLEKRVAARIGIPSIPISLTISYEAAALSAL
jgi:hypothetical protein